MLSRIYLSIFAVLCLSNAALAADDTPAQQPVYVVLSSLVDDALHSDYSDDQARRIVAMMDRMRQKAPASGASCVLQFSGAMSQVFGVLNNANGSADFIRAAIRRGAVEAAYHGENEPIDLTRPRPNFRRARTARDRWAARTEAAEWFLTEYRDLVTGEVDTEQAGGLKKMQEVFGEAAWVTGVTDELGGDSEYAHQITRFTRRAFLPGLADGATFPARHVHGYRGSVLEMGKLMSPTPECAPEVYWQDDFLRLSDSGGYVTRVVLAEQGTAPLQKLLASLDRSRPHIIRVLLGGTHLYVNPAFLKTANTTPLRWAWEHPKNARVPEGERRPLADVDAAWAREEAVLQWLVDEYFPANSGSRFTSIGDLKRRARTTAGSTVSLATLRQASSALLEGWKALGSHPPAYATADNNYFSLADMFQMLTAALAEKQRTGALPESVRVLPVYGPLEMTQEPGPAQGLLSATNVTRVAAELAAPLNDPTWKRIPDNVIPDWVQVDRFRVNAAQFLRLMAEALLAPSGGTALNIRQSHVYSLSGLIFPYYTPLRRHSELGATWTLKPAPLAR